MPSSPITIPLCVGLAAGAALSQNTVAHWSSYFGAQGDSDVAMVVKRGPGSLVTIAGHTAANGLATAGAYRPAITGPVGNVDAFVARFDASQPNAWQLLWCTYFGGDDLELLADAEVDASGAVTIVGMTRSTAASFPIVGGFQTARSGASDGFVATIDAQGAQLTYSTYLGSNADDRIGALEIDPAGRFVVAGIAEGPGLPTTPGAVWSTHQGNTDAFVATIDTAAPAASQVVWATYVGGPFNEGGPASNWAGWNAQWEGFMRPVGLVLEPNGDVALVTPTQSSGLTTTANALQATIAGFPNAYLVRLSAGATALAYATYFGGPSNFVRDMLAHPDGGYVVIGGSNTSGAPTTAGCLQSAYKGGPWGGNSEGFFCWIDPALSGSQQLRYASYLGGDGGEDGLTSAAIESSGVLTLCGYLSGGYSLRSTTGSLQPGSSANEYTGYVARIAMNGNGDDDLLYATYFGDAWTVMNGIALDDVGDAIVVGTTYGGAYPTTANAWQAAHTNPYSLRDAVVTYLPLMAGGTTRYGTASATPACTAPLYHGTFGTPISPNPAFALSATNAPPFGIGVLAFGTWIVATPFLNIQALVAPTVVLGVSADGLGFATQALPIPAGLSGFQLHSQWAFLTNASCPGSGLFAASEGLLLTTL